VEGVTVNGITDNIPAINDVQVGIGRGITYDEVRRHAPWRSSATTFSRASSKGVDPWARPSPIEGDPYEVVGVAQIAGQRVRQLAGQLRDDSHRELFQNLRRATESAWWPRPSTSRTWWRRRTKCACCCAPTATWARRRTTTSCLFASDTIVSLWERLTKTISAMAVGMVSVFMVVGGIVIMNIMLAVVTERTHEIGIRKSLGARRRDILNQYLVESAVLAGAGGLGGSGGGVVMAVAVRSLTSVPMALPWTSVADRGGTLGTVGLFFGIYPARQASKLDPIEALRVER
jgi:putative ABC transport system permease protein